MRPGLEAAWAALPEPLRRTLAPASTGWRRLAHSAALCLELAAAVPAASHGDATRLRALAADMALWAFGENPLSGPLAAEILAAPGLPLPAPGRAALAGVAAGWRAPAPEPAQAFARLAAARDIQGLADFLAARLAEEPAALFWRDKALALALHHGPGEAGAALERLALDGPLGGLEALPGLAPVAALLRAQAAFLAGDAGRCVELLAAGDLDETFGPALVPARRGLALLRAGEDGAALPPLLRALAAAPWQASLARTAADAASGLRARLAPPPGPALVALYTWNKAADLDATLASLAASDLSCQGGRARVVVLDNGSTDDTPRVLDAWAARLGEGLSRVDLPVNIGAPAARNWLAALPEARAAACLVYLDDDVELPPDWLQRLGAGLALRPEAGVVGCRVADHQAPALLQNAAGHLALPQDARNDRPDMDFASLTPNPFRLDDAHLSGPDWGLFSHVLDCASVTGCCHLFPRAALDAGFKAGGGFSLALGPSQYDDFERDLRMLAGGRLALCQGHLLVRHRKRSGLAGQTRQGWDAASASGAGNRYKMQTMHPRAEIAGFLAAQAQRLEEATRAAFAALDAQAQPQPATEAP